MSQSLRARSTSSGKDQSVKDDLIKDSPLSNSVKSKKNQEVEPLVDKEEASEPNFGQRAFSQALTSTAHLANLLPTGTVLIFQLLIPSFSNKGDCDAVTHVMTHILLVVLSASCFLASFTDSIRTTDGTVYYGFATFKGLWLWDCPVIPSSSDATERSLPVMPELSRYRLKFVDFVHAVLSVLVFLVVAFRDKDVMTCLIPSPSREVKEVLDAIPLAIGLLSSMLFLIFPTRRHGIGYPITNVN